MSAIQTFGPQVFVGGTTRILEDKAGKAVLDTNHNGEIDATDAYVLTRNSIEGCTGQVPTDYSNLRAHAGSLGRATSKEVVDSMNRYEFAGSAMQVTDVLPQDAPAGLVSTVFHFDTQQPYAEFIVQS